MTEGRVEALIEVIAREAREKQEQVTKAFLKLLEAEVNKGLPKVKRLKLTEDEDVGGLVW